MSKEEQELVRQLIVAVTSLAAAFTEQTTLMRTGQAEIQKRIERIQSQPGPALTVPGQTN